MKYRHKPLIIEAIQFKGDNFKDVQAFTDNSPTVQLTSDSKGPYLAVGSQVFWSHCEIGDWVIKGTDSQITHLKARHFEELYEPAD